MYNNVKLEDGPFRDGVPGCGKKLDPV